VNLLRHSDRDIWDFAGANCFTIVTTDADFYELATTVGLPPKVIWLCHRTHPTKDAERVLRREAVRIAEVSVDPDLGHPAARSRLT
jgi:predicted nuclease of predicted toxin-antitoxin system